jgi:hypothetical protein
MEHRMLFGEAKLVFRKALLFYALKGLGVDTNPEARRTKDQQITLLNQNQVTLNQSAR